MSAKKLDRQTALAGRPERTPTLRLEEREDGGLRVTVQLMRRRWLGLFGEEGEIERTFGLDPLGRDVYEWCDGKTDVKGLIRRFANKHRVSGAEAGIAVTRFLKTLMGRGLVAMALDKGRLRRKK